MFSGTGTKEKYLESKSIRQKLQESKRNNKPIPEKYLKYKQNRCQNSKES